MRHEDLMPGESGGRMVSTIESNRLARIKRTESIAARTYRELRNALLRQAIAPGQRLVEADLAQQLGVSRTPVREALARLVAEGLVVVLPSGGMAARDTRSELADMYGLRQVLEGYAARLAAARIEPEELDRLSQLAHQMAVCIEDGALDHYVELNNAFHLQIAAASRSPRLVAMINDYHEYFLTPRVLSRYDRAAMLHSQQQHDALVQTLRARDGDAAERLVHAHFQDAMVFMLDSQ
jgi:DNA-binding GntR family transcriptional regulator